MFELTTGNLRSQDHGLDFQVGSGSLDVFYREISIPGYPALEAGMGRSELGQLR